MKAGLVVYRYHVPRIVVCVSLCSFESSAVRRFRPRFRIGDCDVVTETLAVYVLTIRKVKRWYGDCMTLGYTRH